MRESTREGTPTAGNATIVSTDDGTTWQAPRPIFRGDGPDPPPLDPRIPRNAGQLLAPETAYWSLSG